MLRSAPPESPRPADRRSPSLPPSTLLAAAIALVTLTGTLSAAPAPVGLEVHKKLEKVGRARVLIILDPSAMDLDNESANERARIAAARERVLGELGVVEFTLKRGFAAIPALAGEITTVGLERLLALPGVIRVDLDGGGAVHLAQAVPLVRLDEVQSLGITGEGVTVAILDSGGDTDHPDLGDDLAAEA